jgi:NDP-sugar pyrophosphorylase family protein/aminoglycoside/choline kinase family phosphotransferase
MNKTLNVFIPAAGLGERLRPITDHIPKSLIPILSKPILQIILEKVSTLPVNKIGINLHHKKEAIWNWIKQSAFSKKVKLFPEEQILGTGGALKNAETLLSSSTFLVHNSDILSDIELYKLLEFHLSSKNLVTLAVHDYPEFNNLIVDEKGFLKGVGKSSNTFYEKMPFNSSFLRKQESRETKEMDSREGGNDIKRTGASSENLKAFTGIAVYSPEFLRFLPLGASSVVDAWLKAVAAGYKIGTLDFSRCYWKDIGTPSSYAAAVIDALRDDGETIYIHPSVEGCKHIELDGYVVVEKGNILDKGMLLRNCIMLPGSISPSPLFNSPLAKGGYRGVEGGIGGFLIENCILGPGFKIKLNESEILGFSKEADAILIGTGGSDRKYYRTKKDGDSIVLMQCVRDDPDFERHIEYTRFFQRYSIPVPKLIDVDPDKMNALFEDLGDSSLYSWLKCPREQEQIEEVYRQVLDALILIHTVATEHVSECPLLQNRIFDYEHLRWETGYFIERFVEGIKNIRIKNPTSLNKEFHRLASEVDSFPKTVIHRDFQSQNIMITKGGIPRIVDYQGARLGPPAYDVVSILWDPYYRLKIELRERLLNYYTTEMKRRAEGFNEEIFRESLIPCRLQRHMQALGAYGFLSKIKGKRYFLKYIPEGLRLLKEEVSFSKDEYSELYALVIEL